MGIGPSKIQRLKSPEPHVESRTILGGELLHKDLVYLSYHQSHIFIADTQTNTAKNGSSELWEYFFEVLTSSSLSQRGGAGLLVSRE